MRDMLRAESPVYRGCRGKQRPCRCLDWVLACTGNLHPLQSVLILRPNQASSLQGSLNVSRDILAANDLGIGSGWQQSKQNWALLAVVG